MTEHANRSPALKLVTIFTDGAAVPNPRAGGYGVVLRFGEHFKTLSGGYSRTTNNRMELMAVIIGLEALKERCQVQLHSDSQYIVNAVTSGSAFRWRKNGWAFNASGSKRVKNADLWERLLAAFEKHDVEMIWVKGHAGIADNELCDELAMAASRMKDQPPDPGFAELAPEELSNEQQTQPVLSNRSEKITTEGQPCRKCGTPVLKRIPRKRTVKEGQSYYFAWYFYCPNCKTMYMVEEAKQLVNRAVGENRMSLDE